MSVTEKGGRPLGLPKTGGRKKGTPNRATLTLKEQLDAMGCDPVIELAKIGMNAKDNDTKIRCFTEVAPYVHPRRKPVEISIEHPPVINVNTNLDDPRVLGEGKVDEISSDESATIDLDTGLPKSEESR